mmetsp:Transcript_54356/g.131930  ORF Transcript_54356/g.131930 Transcript_54356/m.131930 type:complete len:373 (+) Transcript_54356:210-1328(+)
MTIIPIPPPKMTTTSNPSPSTTAAKSLSSAPPPSSSIMTRSMKIEDRFNKIIEKSQRPNSNGKIQSSTSTELLIPLTAEYEQLKRRLRSLILSAKKYHQTSVEAQKSRRDFIQELATISNGTPVYDYVGRDLNDKDSDSHQNLIESLQNLVTTNGVAMAGESAVHSAGTTNRSNPRSSISKILEECRGRGDEEETFSLYTLFHTCGSTQAELNNMEYQALIIDYATDWSQIVNNKVDKMMKDVKGLESNRRHYERKVQNLRRRFNDIESKGKVCPKSQVDKLTRNETKLQESYIVYEREATTLCSLLQAVTHDGYKELYPLVKNFIKWDLNRVNRDGDISMYLSTTLNGLSSACGSGSSSKRTKQLFQGTTE